MARTVRVKNSPKCAYSGCIYYVINLAMECNVSGRKVYTHFCCFDDFKKENKGVDGERVFIKRDIPQPPGI